MALPGLSSHREKLVTSRTIPRLRHVVAIMCLSLLSGCATTSPAYTEDQVAQDLHAIHEQLGFTHEDLWNEISHSQGYTREQALDLKHRVGQLVVAYEQLFVQANCKEQHFPSCPKLSTGGLRYNVTILDTEHKDLPPLPPIVDGYRG